MTTALSAGQVDNHFYVANGAPQEFAAFDMHQPTRVLRPVFATHFDEKQMPLIYPMRVSPRGKLRLPWMPSYRINEMRFNHGDTANTAQEHRDFFA